MGNVGEHVANFLYKRAEPIVAFLQVGLFSSSIIYIPKGDCQFGRSDARKSREYFAERAIVFHAYIEDVDWLYWRKYRAFYSPISSFRNLDDHQRTEPSLDWRTIHDLRNDIKSIRTLKLLKSIYGSEDSIPEIKPECLLDEIFFYLIRFGFPQTLINFLLSLLSHTPYKVGPFPSKRHIPRIDSLVYSSNFTLL